MQGDGFGGQTPMAGYFPLGQPIPDGSGEQGTAIILCPKKMVGRVIGKNGETIKALQNFTGAQIQIDQRCDPTRVSIAGPPKALLTASNMVQDIIAGSFKGFAMLRAYANQQSRPGVQFDQLTNQHQVQPLYIKGYGFLPPSQQFSDTNEFVAGLQAPPYDTPIIPQNLPAMYQTGFPSNGMVQPNGLANNMIPNMYTPQDQQQLATLAAMTQAQAQAQLINNVRVNPQIPQIGGVPRAMPQMQMPMNSIPGANSYYQPVSFGLQENGPSSLAAQLEAMNLGQATHNLGQPSHTIGQSADNHSLGHPNPNNPQAQEQIPSNGQNGQQTPNSIATTAPASQSFQPGTSNSGNYLQN